MTYKEIVADIWEFENDVKVITTNCNVKRDGRAVMGKGLALQASKRFKNLAVRHGKILQQGKIACIYYEDLKLIMFPTKHHWSDKSDYNLINKSMNELYDICLNKGISKVIIPRVGCGNGGLPWDKVKESIKSVIERPDIEFIIVHT